MSTEQRTTAADPAGTQGTNGADNVTDPSKKEGSQDPSKEVKPTAEEKKATIVKSYKERIADGVLTMEEIEERQPWVAEAIRSEANPPEKKEVTPLTPEEVDARVDQRFKEKEAAKQIEDAKKLMKPEEVAQFDAKLKELAALPPEKALEYALLAVGQTPEEVKRRKAMTIADDVGDDIIPPQDSDDFVLHQNEKSQEQVREFLRKEQGLVKK